MPTRITIPEPRLPYSSLVPQTELSENESITLKGKFKPGRSFCIDLAQRGDIDEFDQTAFRLQPKPSKRVVERNSKVAGAWGDAETGGGYPFGDKLDFVIEITLKDTGYNVKVNGEDFCDFSHRMQWPLVRFLTITGDATLQEIVIVIP